MIAVTVHEFSHGWVAYKLGDSTAKYSGRLTLNPLAHIDPVWTFLLPLFLFMTTGFVFGAAKPIPINYLADYEYFDSYCSYSVCDNYP